MKIKSFLICVFLSFELHADQVFDLSRYKNMKEIYADQVAVDYIVHRIEDAKTFDGDNVSEYFMKSFSSDNGQVYRTESGDLAGEICFQGGCDIVFQSDCNDPIIVITVLDSAYVFYTEHMDGDVYSDVVNLVAKNISENKYRKDSVSLEIRFFRQ